MLRVEPAETVADDEPRSADLLLARNRADTVQPDGHEIVKPMPRRDPDSPRMSVTAASGTAGRPRDVGHVPPPADAVLPLRTPKSWTQYAPVVAPTPMSL